MTGLFLSGRPVAFRGVCIRSGNLIPWFHRDRLFRRLLLVTLSLAVAMVIAPSSFPNPMGRNAFVDQYVIMISVLASGLFLVRGRIAEKMDNP